MLVDADLERGDLGVVVHHALATGVPLRGAEVEVVDVALLALILVPCGVERVPDVSGAGAFELVDVAALSVGDHGMQALPPAVDPGAEDYSELSGRRFLHADRDGDRAAGADGAKRRAVLRFAGIVDELHMVSVLSDAHYQDIDALSRC